MKNCDQAVVCGVFSHSEIVRPQESWKIVEKYKKYKNWTYNMQ